MASYTGTHYFDIDVQQIFVSVVLANMWRIQCLPIPTCSSEHIFTCLLSYSMVQNII
jgi:hypothetical protein